MAKIRKKRRHEAMLEQGMHSHNTDAKFDPPPAPVGWSWYCDKCAVEVYDRCCVHCGKTKRQRS
jgi:hypothetical protein